VPRQDGNNSLRYPDLRRIMPFAGKRLQRLRLSISELACTATGTVNKKPRYCFSTGVSRCGLFENYARRFARTRTSAAAEASMAARAVRASELLAGTFAATDSVVV